MTTPSSKEWPVEVTYLYETGLDARHAGDLDRGLALQTQALQLTPKTCRLAVAAINGEMGYIHMLREDFAAAEVCFRASTESLPRSDLASLALFHTFLKSHQLEAALREAIRFLELRVAPDYEEMFRDGFGDDLDEELRPLADEARQLISMHRAKTKA